MTIKSFKIDCALVILASFLLPISFTSCALGGYKECEDIYFFNDVNKDESITLNVNNRRIKQRINTLHGAKPPQDNQVFFISITKPTSDTEAFMDDVSEIWIAPNHGRISESAECEDVLGEPENILCGISINNTLSAGVIFDGAKSNEKPQKFKQRMEALTKEIKLNAICNY